MRSLFVVLLLVAAAAAGNWNTFDFNNRDGITTRDGLHQKFILNLLRHLHNDMRNNDFVKYSHTIKVDNKNDYRDLTKVFTVMQMFRNGMFVRRGHSFNILDKLNVLTTKALYDFFDTMNNWNTVAQNLIWCRRHINEYQFYHLMTLLVTHHREFNNIVLPAMYEVLPTQFFTGDVMNQGMKGLMLNFDNLRRNNVVVMQNFTNGMMGSMIDDDNDNFNDLNDIKNNYIKDWDTLKKIVHNINDQTRNLNMVKTQNVNDFNKDIKTKIYNNGRNLNQGNKFDNNGEDRMNYFTQDIGLNNHYYFTRFGNSRVIDDKQMYNNINNKGTYQFLRGTNIDSHELKDKINRRGERYLYNMQQLLARYNLERLSNGLDNVKQVELDGKVDNGVFTKLRLTNGLQMFNRMNGYQVNNDNTRNLVDFIKGLEDRYTNAIDQGYVETLDGKKIDLNDKYGFNTLGNLLHGNNNNVNTHYYRNLERFYRLVFGGNYVNNFDRFDRRFNPSVMGQHETTLRDPVFWQVMKRINNIGKLYKDKLVGYTKKDTDFKGVKINDVKVDKLLTTFGYFDADITNGFNVDLINMCKRKNGFSYNRSFRSGSNSRFRGNNSGNRSDNRSNNRTVIRILRNWSNNRTTMRKNLSKNFSTIRRVLNKSRIIRNNSIRRVMKQMNMSNKRFGNNSTSRVRRLFNNSTVRRVLKNKLFRGGNRSFNRSNNSNNRSGNRSNNRTVIRILRNWSNNRTTMRKNLSKNFSTIRRVLNKSRIIRNNSIRRVMNKMNMSNKRFGKNSTSRVRRLFNNSTVRRVIKNKLNRSGNRSFGGKFTKNISWRNVFGLRQNKSNDRSVIRRFNRHGKFNNKFVRRNNRSNNSSRSSSSSSSSSESNSRSWTRGNRFNSRRRNFNRNSGSFNRSNRRFGNWSLNRTGGRSMRRNENKSNRGFNWRNFFGLRKNNSNSRNRSNMRGSNKRTSVIRNLSKLRRNLSNIRGISKVRNVSKLRKNLSKIRNMRNVRGLSRIRGTSKIRNISKIRNMSKNRKNSFVRNLSKLRRNLSKLRRMNNSGNRGFNRNSSGRRNFSGNRSFNRSFNYSNNRSFGSRSNSRNRMNRFGKTNKSGYFRNIMGLNKRFGVFGRQRRLDTKKFTVTIDVTSDKKQFGIVRIFLGPRINNKQQLNDNRQNFVELDQFIVKMKDGHNIIKRNSIDFKNVVGNPETFNVLYMRTMKFVNGGNNGGNNKKFNTLFNLNYDTNNNNQGFPHRLLLPKGTIGGQDFTLFVTVNDLDETNFKNVKYINGKNWNNFVKDTIKDKRGDDSSSSDSNSSSSSSSDSSSGSNSRGRFNNKSNDSSDSSSSGSNSRGRFNKSNSRGRFNNSNNRRRFNDSNSRGRFNNSNNRGRFNNSNSRGRFSTSNGRGRFNSYEKRVNGIKHMRFNRNKMNFSKNRSGGRGIRVTNDNKVWCKNGNGVLIYNCNNGNKNVGNGNGVLDKRAFGFPLDRNIIDVNGLITDNMFFKDVTIRHVDTSNNN